jgi:TolA-binding protein
MQVMNSLLSLLRPGAVLLAAGLGLSLTAQAQTLDKVIEEGQQKVQANRESQERVNDLVAEKQQKLVRYRALLKQIEGLEQYNTQLRTQIQGQEALITRFDRSIAEVATIERQMLPLIHRMADSLAAYVDLDLPFHEAERLERLEFINKSVNRADLDIGEKFRQVIEAYQVESEYGRKIDTYTDIVSIDGREMEVDILRFGRIALVAQSKDTATTAVWNQESESWEKLDTGTYRNSIRKGILMAKKQASIDLITLPIAAPEVAQ